MAKLAGMAAFITVFLGFGAIAAIMDILKISGPDLPQWSYKPIGYGLAGIMLSLAVSAFVVAKNHVERNQRDT